MTAADSAERAQQHYDPREVQDKWLARWDGMDLFRPAMTPTTTGRAPICWTCSPTRRATSTSGTGTS